MNKTIPARDFCSSVFDGTHDTPKPCKHGHPLILSKNIQGNCINLQDTYNISEEDYNAINMRSKVSQWDILFSMIGTVGSVYLEKNEDIPYAIKNMGVFSTKDELKAKWLYYYLQTNEAKSIIANYLNGAVQKFLPLGFLREFPVKKMPQNASQIISVLENIDAKIENNNAICAELEAMAKLLYDYWFVQFDFPDENGHPYKSSGGKMVWNEELKREIPEGWEACNIGDILQFQKGKIPDSLTARPNEENQYPYLTIDVANGGMPEFCARDRMPFCNGETIMVMDGAASGDVYVGNIGVLGSTFAMLVPKRKGITNAMIYWVLRANQSLYKRANTGSTVPHANRGFIEAMSICIPRNLQFFTKAFDDIQSLIVCAKEENRELASLRDFLLPMLMNGQVSFKEVC